jgi:serine/threonine protein kinase
MGISVAVPSLLLLSLLLPPAAAHFSFTYNFTAASASDSAPSGISFQGDAFFNKYIRLTRDERVGPLTSSAGRAYFSRPIALSDPITRRLASFASSFAFSISAPEPSAASGDGLAFFLSPFPSVLPNSSAGGLLGLFNSSTRDAIIPLVAIEFDTFLNDWDPSDDHVGINLGGIVSDATADWPTSMKDGRTAHARVAYDGDTKNLTVALSYGESPPTDVVLWFAVDLREHLPDAVAIGFSAATGEAAELHKVLYWDFTSSVDPEKGTIMLWVALGVCGLLVVLIGAGVVWFAKEWRKAGEPVLYGDIDIDDAMGYEELGDDEFVVESGPRRFRYAELASATKNFSEERKLGQGGFGAVYRGFLKELALEVAIKRVSKGSTQGRKEYAAEVRIISQLRHRHLVRLVGWCHEHRGDFLLVYELMPNGSVDHHLYGKGVLLTWPTRYDIALGLASALLYLHEECRQCIVHRDIKPSNVMLDAAFSAKLGDFGLAKLVEHGSQPYTTVLAGTLGYLAPECLTTGKSSRESDVYSFGVVALEIACGRRPAELTEEPSKARLVPWVWELYGKKALLEAADWRLKGEFDEKQMEHLMVVGLWCAHPDYTHRPSIRQALNVLKLEAPLPVLAPKMPVPTFFPLPDLASSVVSVEALSSTDYPGVNEYESSARSGPSSRDRLLEP